MKRLVVLRHAKAESHAASDRERPLTRRGRADAAAAGAFLREVAAVPDHAVVSAALRTRQTWEEVREASAAQATEEVTERLYGADPHEVLAELRLVPEEVRTVLYVGHNPTAETLALLLDDGQGNPDLLRGLLEGFPTATAAVFEVDGPWGTLAEGGARVAHLYVARADGTGSALTGR